MDAIQAAAFWIAQADALMIATGAGMGVDSGLADYRGNGGQWGQVEAENEKSVFEVINPQALLDDPLHGWGLYAKRIKEYANTPPHQGFHLLLDWIERFKLDYFVLTSNIDSHFQKAGFEEARIRELHGTLAYFQTSRPDIAPSVWKNELSAEQIEEMLQRGEYPTCRMTGAMARPNVYMFRDNTYINRRSKAQKELYMQFLERNLGKKMVILEIGSGPHVQTVRAKVREARTSHGALVVRINPKDFAVKPPHIGIAKGALEALREIDACLKGN